MLTAGHRMFKAAALTGAVAPSSRYLARAMARAAHGADALVELGAGGGAVTRTLAEVYPELRLVVVELRNDLVLKLRQEFEGLEIHAAPAATVLRSLAELPAATGIVSSLPFRSMPKLAKHETVCSILDFLGKCPGRFMVQFTYYPGAPFPVPVEFKWRKTSWVARNLPPAAVWVLEPSAGRLRARVARASAGTVEAG